MKNSKILSLIMLILLVCFSFTGCNTKNNLKDLSIVEGMGIDYTDENIEVTIQTLNLVKEGSGTEALSENVTINTSGSGENISGALKNLAKSLSKKLFFGQNRVIVFGKEFAENHLDKNLDFFLRSGNSRADIILCVADETAKEVIESNENDAIVPAESIASLLVSGEKRGFSARVTTNELLNLYADKTSDMYLPVIKCEDGNISVLGIAIYDDNKLVSVLGDDDMQGLLFLKDKIESGLILVESTNLGKTTIEITKSSSKANVKYENGKLVLHEKIDTKIRLNEAENGIVETISNDDIEEIKVLTEKKIEKICNSAFYRCVENGSDCIRLGENLAMRNPAAYSKLSDNWNEALKNAEIKTEVNCNISKINEHSKKN